MSHPAWGVWIETRRLIMRKTAKHCHTPHGVCGLKPENNCCIGVEVASHPAWGVWIETKSK